MWVSGLKSDFIFSFCNYILFFTVIYGLLGHDALDLQEDMAEVFEAAEMSPEVGKKRINLN